MRLVADGNQGYNAGMTTDTTTTEADPADPIIPVVGEYVAVKPGYCGGKPHIVGHRIKVQHIAVWHERMGMTAEEIVATYPTLSLSAVFAAPAYYHSHRAEIDADIEADCAVCGRNESQGRTIEAPGKVGRTSCHGRSASTWMKTATRG